MFLQKMQRAIKESALESLPNALYPLVWEMMECYEMKVPLGPMVRALVLRVTLWIFGMRGNVPARELVDLGDVLFNTKMEVTDLQDNHDLQAHLSALFPGYNLNPRANPLNALLHCFETLTPVVLRLFLELRRHSSYKDILLAFIQKPTPAQFNLLADGAISAEYLVKETLRLYPPNRQIHRAFQPTIDPATRLVLTADIEACQLDYKAWADPLHFRPERWRKASVVQNLSFLAFGSRPFLCPASHDFGLRVVALIGGVLVDVLGDNWVLSFADGEVCAGERLSNEWGAYEDVSIELDC